VAASSEATSRNGVDVDGQKLGAELGRGEFGVTRRREDVATGEALTCKI
jgi:hypothetical protein